MQIWDRQGALLRELVFDSSLSACCLADAKGTVVIGYKSHLNTVTVENYLPSAALQRILLDDYQVGCC